MRKPRSRGLWGAGSGWGAWERQSFKREGEQTQMNKRKEVMRVADYKELRVSRLAFILALEIFELSRKFPSEEKFSLTGGCNLFVPTLQTRMLQNDNYFQHR